MSQSSLIYRTLPPIADTGPLPPLISVIVPEETTNLVINPSVERNDTGYTLVSGASIARSTTQQRRGAWSLGVTPGSNTGSGVYFGTVSLVSGTTYTFSVDIYGVSGVPYKIYFASTAGAQVGSARTFKGKGRWERVSISYTETSTTTRRVYITKDGSASTSVFYIDGLQVEAKAYATTYCDGDMSGVISNQFPPAFLWTGTPHASTSTRSGQTRAGGKVVRLDRWAFTLLAIIGLGLATPNNIALPYAQLDGAQYQDTQKLPRTFQLGGRFDAGTFDHLRRQRGALAAVLDRDLVGLRQPLTLRYQDVDERERPIGEPLDIVASYDGGLEGNTISRLGEEATITFTQHLPALYGGDAGVGVDILQSVSNANYILYRTPGGVWQALSTGMNGSVVSLARGIDGSIYAGGTFTTSGGTTTNRVARWNGSAWSAMGGTPGVNSGIVWSLAVAANGDLYVGGGFTLAGGVANTARIAKWNGSAWSALGTGAAGVSTEVRAVVIGPDGSVYIGGSFTSAGGVANTAGIAKWDPLASTWSALGTGAAGGEVIALAFGPDGSLYAAGDFTSMGGVANTLRIAKWNGSAWSALSTGINGDVNTLTFGPDGILYAAGNFTSAGGITVANVAKWNGTIWSGVGSGTDLEVLDLAFDNQALLNMVGSFTRAGGIPLPDAYARWNGSAWTPGDVDFPGLPVVYTVLPVPDGGFYIGFSTSGSATTADITSVTNSGTAQAYPRFTIEAPPLVSSRVYQLINITTGRAIYFNLLLQPAERVVLNLEPSNLSFESSFRGNIMSAILPGSNTADFFLQPGANTISFFASDGSTVATMNWRTAYNSVDDAIP